MQFVSNKEKNTSSFFLAKNEKICYNMTGFRGYNMIKKFKIGKKELLAGAIAFTLTMTGCGNNNDKTRTNNKPEYNTIYYTSYNEYNRELEWQEITKSDYKTMDESIIADTDIEDNVLYVATYQALGYEAASKFETKQEAISNNPEYSGNSQFISGFELGQQDKYLEKAQTEQKQYVAIRKNLEPTNNMEETKYYKAEDITVISYNGANALVLNYDEEKVKSGNYEDLLGKDMSNYIGSSFKKESLRNFATDYIEDIADSIYMVSGNYRVIPEITQETFTMKNDMEKSLTK